MRGERSKLRLLIIRAAYAGLDPRYKHQPYSNDSIDALHGEYLSLVGKGGCDTPPSTPPTEDEIDSLISTMATLSGPDRPMPQYLSQTSIDALREVCESFFAPPPIIPTTADEVEAFDLQLSLLVRMTELSETDLHALQKVSRETLRKGLKQLGVKSMRQAKRSG